MTPLRLPARPLPREGRARHFAWRRPDTVAGPGSAGLYVNASDQIVRAQFQA